MLYALCDMIWQMRFEECKINLKIVFLTHAPHHQFAGHAVLVEQSTDDPVAAVLPRAAGTLKRQWLIQNL